MTHTAWRTSHSVVPTSPQPLASTSVTPTPTWLYRVEPSRALPVLDLSVTLKSKVLTATGERWFDRVFRFHRAMFLGYFFTLMMYVVVIVTPPHIAQVLAVIGLATGMPGPISTLGLLRYDVVKALISTYDTIFFNVVVVSTLTVLMFMLNDLRILVVLQSLIAIEVNIFLDANLQAVRRLAMINAFGSACTLLVAIITSFGLAPAMNNFVLFETWTHRLEAQAFIANGFATTLAFLFRAFYRKRRVITDRTKGATVECVSYRSPLGLRLYEPDAAPPPSSPVEPMQQPSTQPKHIQQMRYIQCLPLIDAHRVCCPRVFTALLQSEQRHVIRRLCPALGWLAAALSILAGSYKFLELKLVKHGASPTWLPAPDTADHLLVVALVLTSAFSLVCNALYQRQLLFALLTSFDFVFLSSQVTVVHLALADLFQWRRWCLLLLLTWLWSHWVLCIDAMTPVVREHIGFSPRFLQCITTMLVISTAVLNNAIMFDEVAATLKDRVLCSFHIFHERVEFRLLATFYSNYANVLAWALRLLWRVYHAQRDELVMLDGPVAYDNYLRQPKASRRSVPRLSLIPKAKQPLPATAHDASASSCPHTH